MRNRTKNYAILFCLLSIGYSHIAFSGVCEVGKMEKLLEKIVPSDSRPRGATKNGIAEVQPPRNPLGWKPSNSENDLNDVLRRPTSEEHQLIHQEIALIQETVGSQFRFPKMPEVLISMRGEGYYEHKINRIVIPHDGDKIHVPVLWHEYGHAVMAANDRYPVNIAQSSWEAGYDELFADSIALMRNTLPEEIRANGASFTAQVSTHGWVDHEEHQLFIPTRSALGRMILRFNKPLSLADKHNFLENVLTASISERETWRQATRLGRFKETPESLNLSLLARLTRMHWFVR